MTTSTTKWYGYLPVVFSLSLLVLSSIVFVVSVILMVLNFSEGLAVTAVASLGLAGLSLIPVVKDLSK